jgi:hypothetical protein
MSRTIPASEAQPHRGSFADPNGRLFFWRGGLYRALAPAFGAVADRLYAGGFMDSLVERGLVVESAPTDLLFEGAAKVVRHRQVPVVTYPCEWSPAMLKTAALHVIDLETALARNGMTIRDAHSWNVLFDRGRPSFVDICAFGLAQDSSASARGAATWPGFAGFCQFLLYPLIAAEAGLERFSRLGFLDLKGLSAAELAGLLGRRAAAGAPSRAGFVRQFGNLPQHPLLAAIRRRLPGEPRSLARAGREEFLRLLRSYVEGIEPAVARGQWSSYYQPAAGSAQASAAEVDVAKIAGVRAILERLRPATVLDVGANTGYYSRIALAAGAAVVAVDGEVSCVDELHLSARDGKLGLDCALIDAKNPTPGLGPAGAELPSCFERLRCEMVMALAITHHLAYRSLMTFDQMMQSFAAWSTRYLLVEYIPPDDPYVKSWNLQAKGWYGFEQFRDAISRHFVIADVLESSPASRRLVVAEKRAAGGSL